MRTLKAKNQGNNFLHFVFRIPQVRFPEGYFFIRRKKPFFGFEPTQLLTFIIFIKSYNMILNDLKKSNFYKNIVLARNFFRGGRN